MAIKTNGSAGSKVVESAVENSDELWKAAEHFCSAWFAKVCSTEGCGGNSFLEEGHAGIRRKVENSGVFLDSLQRTTEAPNRFFELRASGLIGGRVPRGT